VADRGGTTLEEVGDILNLTRERIRQVEVLGLEKLRTVYSELGEEIPEGGIEIPDDLVIEHVFDPGS